jgi:hypothetical protein
MICAADAPKMGREIEGEAAGMNDNMNDERISRWVRLCENLCAPEQVIRWDALEGAAEASPLPCGEQEAGPSDAIEPMTLGELPRRTADLAGVLRRRTMYVLPFADFPEAGAPPRAGLVVTDSPQIIEERRRRFVIGRAALAALEASREILAELHLVFPPRHLAVSLSRDIPEVRESFGPCEKGKERRALPIASPPSGKAVPCTVCQRICPERQAAAPIPAMQDTSTR